MAREETELVDPGPEGVWVEGGDIAAEGRVLDGEGAGGEVEQAEMSAAARTRTTDLPFIA